MKILAYQHYTYTGLLQDYVILNDSNGTVAYHDVGRVRFDFMTDPNSPRVVIVSSQPFRKSAIIKDILDSKGTPVMGDSAYIVTAVEPLLSVYGEFEGYQMQAALNAEADWSNYEYELV